MSVPARFIAQFLHNTCFVHAIKKTRPVQVPVNASATGLKTPQRTPAQLSLPGIPPLAEGINKQDKKPEQLGPYAAAFAVLGTLSVVIASVVFTVYSAFSDFSKASIGTSRDSSVCSFSGTELVCNPNRADTDELELYVSRLPYQLNMANPAVVKLLQETAFFVSSSDNEPCDGGTVAFGTYLESKRKVSVYRDAVPQSPSSNVALHEFLHAAYRWIFDDAMREELALAINPLIALAKQMDCYSIPWLEKEIGPLNPLEKTFLMRVKELLERPSVKADPVNELFAYMGGYTDFGVPSVLVHFYAPLLSEDYLRNRLADSQIRFREIFSAYNRQLVFPPKQESCVSEASKN